MIARFGVEVLDYEFESSKIFATSCLESIKNPKARFKWEDIRNEDRSFIIWQL